MRNKVRNFTALSLIILVIFGISPVVLAKSRSSHLIDFLYTQQNEDQTFGTSYEDTARAIEIIDHYDAYLVSNLFEEDKKVDKETLGENLNNRIVNLFETESITQTTSIPNLYYILKTLKIIEYTIDSSLNESILQYFSECAQDGGGFGFSNSSTSSNMAPTFFVMNSYYLLDVSIPNVTNHKNWILSCGNSDGGYGGNETLISTLTSTYYAVNLIDGITSTDDLINESATLEYLLAFYIDNPNNNKNYGGFTPTIISDNALLSSTLICVESIAAINENDLDSTATTNWVLPLQNFQDGGFSDNSFDFQPRLSTIVSSSYAFNTLVKFGAESELDKHAFMVEFNPLYLIIFLVVVTVVIVVIIVIIRRRKRI